MGFSFGGLAKAFAPMALTVLTGGAAAPMVMAQQMAMRALASQVLNFAAQQLGVSPAILQAALGAFGQSSGLGGMTGSFAEVQQSGDWAGFLRQNGGSPMEIGRAAREFNKLVNEAQREIKSSLQDQLNELNRNDSNKKLERDVRAVMNGKGSILMKLAIALGMIADNKMNAMAKKAEDIGAMGKISEKNQSKFTQMNAELNALGQEYSVVSQAMNTVLKTVGEASATIARKS